MRQLGHSKNVHLAVLNADPLNRDELDRLTTALEEALSDPCPLVRHLPLSGSSRVGHTPRRRLRALASDFTQTLLLRNSILVRSSKSKSPGDSISQ